ncbi:hypothetical protein BY457_12115 [Marinilabilia salmonicolor]|jgi:hypothetical protein|nr:hypothetical protein BY457_12115 [Marinilabilia salmonicolor]
MKTTHTFGIQFAVSKNKAKNRLLPVYTRIKVNDPCVKI